MTLSCSGRRVMVIRASLGPLCFKLAGLGGAKSNRLDALRFAANPLGNPHPELRLVAYRLRSRDVLCRGDMFGGQTQRNRRLCAGMAVAGLPCPMQANPAPRGP